MPAPEASDRPVCVIIGAGPGMGEALARAFAADGCTVALIARSLDRLAVAVEQLRQDGVDAHAFAADASDPDGLRGALDAARAALGPVQVLVCNSSLLVPGAPMEVEPEAVIEGMRVGVLPVLVAVQHVVDDLVANGGTVLVTGGGTALRPWTAAAGLSMQKAAVRNLVFALADELTPQGVHVATVTIRGVVGAPGMEPDTIAQQFVALHRERSHDGSWTVERFADPPPA